MNWDALGAIGEIVGAISVLLTLIYLATQIKQSNRIAIASREIEIQNNLSSINESIYGDATLANLLDKAKDPNANFTGAELLQMQAWTRRLINAWLAIETAYKNEMTSERTYNLIFDDIRAAVSLFPGIFSEWKFAIDNYPMAQDTIVFTAISDVLEELS